MIILCVAVTLYGTYVLYTKAEPEETITYQEEPEIAVLSAELVKAQEAPPAPPSAHYEALQNSVTDEERGLLALVVYHEARGESFEGQCAVVEVVFNRVLDEKFAENTVKDIIYAPGQFATASYLTTAAIKSPGCIAVAMDAVETVLNETEPVLGDSYLYFGTKQPSTSSYQQIGNHYFR